MCDKQMLLRRKKGKSLSVFLLCETIKKSPKEQSCLEQRWENNESGKKKAMTTARESFNLVSKFYTIFIEISDQRCLQMMKIENFRIKEIGA